MSIAMERFGSSECVSKSRVLSPPFPFRMQCRSCGFEPDGVIKLPERCPKCAGQAFERFIRPGSLLQYADQRAEKARQALIAGNDALKPGPKRAESRLNRSQS